MVRPPEKYEVHDRYRKNVIQNENCYGLSDGECLIPCDKSYAFTQRRDTLCMGRTLAQ